MPVLTRTVAVLSLSMCLAMLATSAQASPPATDTEAPDVVIYGQRDDVRRFGAELAAAHGLDAAWVQSKLAESRYQPNVAKFIMPPANGTAKNWAAYRARFVEPKRIRAGLAFWRTNERWLVRAQALYGVPPELVVGIVGVETLYGQQMGGFRTIDALATLAFDFPPGRRDRSAFFREELAQLFVLSHREGLDPLRLKSSYAGAMGMGQFMPSSWNKYAVDFDGDGHIDLHHSAADVIGSVANFLAQFGWQRGVPARFAVTPPVDASARAALLVPDIVPSFSAQHMSEQGAQLDSAGARYGDKLALVELQNGDAAPSFVAGTSNFYAVTRYNWSSYYAMAVLDLGEAIAQIRERTAEAAPANTRAPSPAQAGSSPSSAAAKAEANSAGH